MLYVVVRDALAVLGMLVIAHHAGCLVGHAIGGIVARAILRRHGAPANPSK